MFRVGAAQLAEGRGLACCGECRTTFCALDTLAEVLPDPHQPSLKLHAAASREPLLTLISRAAPGPETALFEPVPPADTRPDAQSVVSTLPSSDGDFVEGDAGTLEPVSLPGTDGLESQTVRFDANGWPMADDEEDSAVRPLPDDRVPALFAETVPSRPHASHRPLDRIAARRSHRDALAAVPPAFARRSRRRLHRSGGGWGWWFASAMLLLLLSGQAAWAARGELLDVPALRPWILEACERLRCPLAQRATPDALTLASRDVRPHPSVAEALIIGATLLNRGATTQPFPVIEITLADVNEHRVGMRRFQPGEYVSDTATLQRGIPPGGTALFSVEVEDPGKRAVAFEFEFL